MSQAYLFQRIEDSPSVSPRCPSYRLVQGLDVLKLLELRGFRCHSQLLLSQTNSSQGEHIVPGGLNTCSSLGGGAGRGGLGGLLGFEKLGFIGEGGLGQDFLPGRLNTCSSLGGGKGGLAGGLRGVGGV